MGELEDKYPHWKDALFGNHGLRANLRCALKYLVWHISYGLLSVIGLVAYGIFATIDRVSNTALAQTVGEKLRTPQAKQIVRGGVYVVGGSIVVAFLGGVVYLAITEPVELAVTVGLVLGFFGAVFAFLTVLEYLSSTKTVDKTTDVVVKGAATVGQKSKVTPVARRVYGQCPVSMDMEPRWFQKFQSRFEE